MKQRTILLARIYRLKVAIVALFSLILGVSLFVLSKYIDGHTNWHWFSFWPIGEVGGTLTAAGLFGIAWDYVDGQDKEAREDERIRRLLKESAPEFRDAVVQGFAVETEDLKRVANPELLDGIATNVLALRLGDRQFAEEIYTDVRDLAIRTPERWYDADVSIWLSSIDERDDSGVPRFAVTVQWEYTVTPSHPVQRFACVSDSDEFHELTTDIPATSTWFMTPRPGFDATKREAFELVDFSVDGEPRSIRRQTHKSGQIYSANIGDDIVIQAKPVRIRHTYRTITDPATHRLFVAIAQPARNVSINIDYSDTTISRMTVTDLVASSRRPYVGHLPDRAEGKELAIQVPGWVQAGTGFTFVWTLVSEEQSPRVPRSEASAA